MNPDRAEELSPFPGLGFDPAPGSLRSVSQSAREYSTLAEQLRSARDAIDSIVKQRGMWEGEASEAFARRVGELPKYLGTATGSMTKAANALSTWSDSLSHMQKSAKELEAQAQRAKKELEAARNNPAFELAGRTFSDPGSLRSAEQALGHASTQLDEATNKLESIIQSARRIQQQHTELAERIAAVLGQAREMAPDEPGLFGKMLDGLGEAFTEVANTMIDIQRDVAQAIGDFIRDNANVIGEISTVIGDISTIIGTIGDLLPPPASTVADAVSLGLGSYAAAGHAVANAAGADVGAETHILDGVGIGSGLIPSRGGGLANAGFLSGTDYAAHTQGEDLDTPFGKLMDPDERQVDAGVDIITGILTDETGDAGDGGDGGDAVDQAISATPLVGHWKFDLEDASEKDEAGQAERDHQRARARVWE